MIMLNRPLFTLLTLALLSLPTALLAGVVQTQNFNYPLTSGGTFSIEDANGTITITASDRNQVEITATKHADTQADLDAIRIDIKLASDKIEVRTLYPSSGSHSGGVSYQIAVPKDLGHLTATTANGSISVANVGGEVSMKSENGGITATDLRGAFTLSTTNGSVNAVCTDLAGDGHLRTTNGTITLELPRSADASVHADTTVGRIESNLPDSTVNKGVVGETLEAKLGAGSHRLEVKTTNGSIRLEAR
jgi:DUF4097 and DUF4098 domain-containing protein YvlB